MVGRLGAARGRVRGPRVAVVRGRRRPGVLRGLPHREVLGRGQRLRLGDHLQLLRRPAGAPAPRPVPRRRRRARAPRDLHRRRRSAHRQPWLDPLPLRRLPPVDRLPDAAAAGRAPRPRPVASSAPLPPLRAHDRRVPRPAAPRAHRRRRARDAAPRGARARGGDGPGVRRGLHPRDLRRHGRGVPRLHRQRVRSARPASPVLPACRPHPSVRPPQDRARAGDAVGRRQDAPQDRPVRHPHGGLAGCDRDDPHVRRGRQPRGHAWPGTPDAARAGRAASRPSRRWRASSRCSPAGPGSGGEPVDGHARADGRRVTPGPTRPRRHRRLPTPHGSARTAGRQRRRGLPRRQGRTPTGRARAPAFS